MLRTIRSPRDYAHGILNVCKRYAASPLASVSGVSSANIRKRIDAILANRVGDPIGVWKRLALSAIITLFVITLFVITPLGVGAMNAAKANAAAPEVAIAIQQRCAVGFRAAKVRTRPAACRR